MKLLHLADLHLGLKLNGYDLAEDQAYILQQIVDYVREERPQAVLIAGDVYDRSVPAEGALGLFETFLRRLAELGSLVFVIAGNHDSAARLSFGKDFFSAGGVYLAPAFAGTLAKVSLADEYGPVNIYLLPFVRPAMVRRFFPQLELADYNAALAAVLATAPLDPSQRNVLVAHQYVQGSLFSGTDETIQVGGLDNAAAELFAPFDYTALGHIHRPQAIGGRENLRYAGTPLKYSVKELGQQKSLPLVELGPKGSLEIRLLPLTPLRELVQLRGSYQELMSQAYYSQRRRDDYIQFLLTDTEEVPEAMRKLQSVYSHPLSLKYAGKRGQAPLPQGGSAAARSPMELFAAFYRQQQGQDLSPQQQAVLRETLATVEEAGHEAH